jgi:hypothetical protein
MTFTDTQATTNTSKMPDWQNIWSNDYLHSEFEMTETGFSGDEGKCLARANSGTTTLTSCASPTPAVEVPIMEPPYFYSKGGCTVYANSGWEEELAFYIQEVDTSGNVDTGLGRGIRVPDTVSPVSPTNYRLYATVGETEPQQALGVSGASDAAAFRMVVADDTGPTGAILDVGDNNSATIKCWVDVFPSDLQNRSNHWWYGTP